MARARVATALLAGGYRGRSWGSYREKRLTHETAHVVPLANALDDVIELRFGEPPSNRNRYLVGRECVDAREIAARFGVTPKCNVLVVSRVPPSPPDPSPPRGGGRTRYNA